MSDRMQNQTSPGIQTRRYRLLEIHPASGPGVFDGSHMGILQVVQDHLPPQDRVIPLKFIDANFLPISAIEVFAFMEDVGPVIRIDQRSIGEEIPESIEYEITVRRITPPPADSDNPYGLDFGDWKDSAP